MRIHRSFKEFQSGRISSRLLAVGIGCVLSLMMLVAVDCAVGLLTRNPEGIVWESKETNVFFVPDSILGYRPPHFECRIAARKTSATGKTIYNRIYTFNQNGRRLTPRSLQHPSERFAIFVGDSFTFGEGLGDDETLPFFFSRTDPTYHSYNFGFSGYGPQHVCEILGDSSLRTEVVESQGILVYTFIDDHISRAIGSMNTYNGWCRKCPYFVLQTDGSVKREGNFTNSRIVQSLAYRVLGYSAILKQFRIDFPATITNDHFSLTAGLIAESTRRFRSYFPGCDFWVIMYPGSVLGPSEMVPRLKALGIKVLDYSSRVDLRKGQYVIDAEDLHPSAKANEYLATTIANDIRNTAGNAR